MLDGEHQHMAVCDRTLVQCYIALLACNIRYYIFLNCTTRAMRSYSGTGLATFGLPTPAGMLSQPVGSHEWRLQMFIILGMLYEMVCIKAHLCWPPG